ncbi:MAG: hypothetical protein K0R49_1183, partial [Burkholderiales bacterium]|nr:hypothetical protein [Burkholderiales bacterium]
MKTKQCGVSAELNENQTKNKVVNFKYAF